MTSPAHRLAYLSSIICSLIPVKNLIRGGGSVHYGLGRKRQSVATRPVAGCRRTDCVNIRPNGYIISNLLERIHTHTLKLQYIRDALHAVQLLLPVTDNLLGKLHAGIAAAQQGRQHNLRGRVDIYFPGDFLAVADRYFVRNTAEGLDIYRLGLVGVAALTS